MGYRGSEVPPGHHPPLPPTHLNGSVAPMFANRDREVMSGIRGFTGHANPHPWRWAGLIAVSLWMIARRLVQARQA